jgi:hypothetical protein
MQGFRCYANRNSQPAKLAVALADLPVDKLTFHRPMTVKELLKYQLMSLFPNFCGFPPFIEK